MIVIQPKTIKIVINKDNVTGRLSPDLSAMADFFTWDADPKKKLLKLFPADGDGNGNVLKAWKSGARSKSRTIGLKTILKKLGVDSLKVKDREYDVQVRGKTLEVQF